MSEWLYRDDRLRESLFAFADRLDLAVLFAPPPGEAASDPSLELAFDAAARFDLDAWIRVGVPVEHAAETLVSDDDALGSHLDRVRSVVRRHADVFDDGRVVLWEEAPVMGRWIPGGAWNRRAVEAMQTHGPALFASQRAAVLDVADYPIGIFVHFPYVVDSKSPDVFPALVDRLRDRGATPDFAFTDFYRGWYEKDVGPGPADAAVRSLVANAGRALDGRDVFYLGQAHTINPGHAPSRQSIRSTVRAATDADVAGIGWYARSEYVPTTGGFDPFVPNAADARFGDDPVGTATVARDRFTDAYLATLASRPDADPADRFDLWIVGDDLGLHDHRIALGTTRADLQFVGHVGSYADGEYPYAPGDGDVAIVRGLRREWLPEDEVLIRIRTRGEADEATLHSVRLLPCDPATYLPGHLAAERLQQGVDPGPASLGGAVRRRSLVPGVDSFVTVTLEAASASRDALRHPDWTDAVGALRTAEADGTVPDPGARFDLWVAGEGLDPPANVPSIRDATERPRQPEAACIVPVADDPVAVYYGLDRSQFRPGDGLELVDDAPTGTAVDGAWAMPYAGCACFRPPSRVAALLARNRAAVEVFSIGSVDRTTPDSYRPT